MLLKDELTKTGGGTIKCYTYFLLLLLVVSFLIPGVSANEQRPVYIISDHINNNAADNARINTIVRELKEAGVKEVYNAGVGVNNYAILSNTPKDAVIIQVMGGACAATIYSMTMENYYLNLKGSRIVYPVWVPPSTDISKVSWLGRSGDDGGHGSFSGISNPAQKLKNAGYKWTYWNDNADLKKIVNDISQMAGVEEKKSGSGTKEGPPTTTVTIGGNKVSKKLPYTLKPGLTNNKYVKVTQIQLSKKIGYDGYKKGNYGSKPFFRICSVYDTASEINKFSM